MGPETDVLTTTPASSSDAGGGLKSRPQSWYDGNVPGHDHNLRFADWLCRSRAASVIWLVVRLVLGYWWLNAGYQKIWGSEKAAFWFGGGAGVKGFATAGVAGSATGKGGASYGWWAAFLHNFVIPNASWIAKLIALGELALGVALILGLFTGLAAAGRAHAQYGLYVHRIGGGQPGLHDPRSAPHFGLAQRGVPRSRPLRTRQCLVAQSLHQGDRSLRASPGWCHTSRPQHRELIRPTNHRYQSAGHTKLVPLTTNKGNVP